MPGEYKEKNGTTRVGDFLRKIQGVAPDILEVAGTLTGLESLEKLGGLIKGTNTMSELDKEHALKLLEHDMLDSKEISKRWSSDMISDSWLSKNVRPIIVMFLTIMMTFCVIADSSFDSFDVKTHWIDLLASLLLLVYGAYFGSRGLEKITKIRYSNEDKKRPS